jgi:TetR/AcrR family transcriptional regulator
VQGPVFEECGDGLPDGSFGRLRADGPGCRPGTCAGLLGAFGAAGRLGEILQSSDTWVAAPLREALTQGHEAGLVAAGDPADAANAILGGLLLAVLGRAMTGADPTDPRFRQHLADQLLRGVVTG